MYFYEFKVKLNKFEMELMALKLEAKEHEYLLGIAKSAVFHKLLDFFLSQLQDEDHKHYFVNLVHKKHPPESIFKFLEEKIEHLDKKLGNEVDKYEQELVKLLK